jgi:hypothetical protein
MRRCQVAGDLARVQAGHEAQGEERAIVRLDVAQGALEVDDADRVCRVTGAAAVEGDRGSTTVARRLRRMAWRASLAAMAMSHDRTCSGCRSPDNRRQAIAQADWTASCVASTSPQMT